MPDVRRARLYKQQSRQHWDQRLCLHPQGRAVPPLSHTAFGRASSWCLELSLAARLGKA